MKRILLLLSLIIAMIAADFALSKTSIPVNEQSYLMGFDAFRQRALQTKGQKRIILVGGSSLAWGVSAKDLTERLKIIVLNSGIHAGVGYRRFMTNIEDTLDPENDILVISPEYSLISEGSLFKRSNEFCEIALYVRHAYPAECIGFSMARTFRLTPVIDRRAGDYFSRGFNQFGDYVYRRADVNMADKNAQDPCSGFDVEDLDDEYIPYVRSIEDKGFKVVYIPNFLPRQACKNKAIIERLHNILFDKFGIEGHRNTKLFFDQRYFYNTSYHLTLEGVKKKTMIFEKQLKSYLEGH